MVTVAVSLPRELVEQIDAEAAKEGASRVEVVRRRVMSELDQSFLDREV